MGILTLLGGIPGFLLKIGIGPIADKIANAYLAKQNSLTDRDKIAADERIGMLEARRDVLVAEGRWPINAIMRSVIASSVAFLLLKVLVYDKALGQWTGGHTDALDANLWGVVQAVLAFYFLYELGSKVTDKVTAVVAKRGK